jgi:hypothetical protein
VVCGQETLTAPPHFKSVHKQKHALMMGGTHVHKEMKLCQMILLPCVHMFECVHSIDLSLDVREKYRGIILIFCPKFARSSKATALACPRPGPLPLFSRAHANCHRERLSQLAFYEGWGLMRGETTS